MDSCESLPALLYSLSLKSSFMCLRYAFSTVDHKLIMDRFELESVNADLKPRYNIAPTQDVPVIFNHSPKTLAEAKWGLPANWHGPGGADKLLFNARMETIDQKPVFRKDFTERRCLMLADSFYEWKHPEKKPFRVFMKDGGMFAFAGIYAQINGKRACCMITTAPNELISTVHIRMPVILPSGKEKVWLGLDDSEAKAMLKPYPAGKMSMYEVSSKVNSSRNDSADLIKPKTDKGTLKEWMK